MLNKLKQRASEEKGFTLIELLVVVLIIGILAAIALPTFLNQRDKAQDSKAKSNARNMVSQIESCAADQNGSYVGCNTQLTGAATGLPVGTADGQVQISAVNTDQGYTIVAQSESNTDFTVQKTAGVISRTKTGGGSW